MAKKLFSVRLSDEVIEFIKKLAAAQERSDAFIVEKIILEKKQSEEVKPSKAPKLPK